MTKATHEAAAKSSRRVLVVAAIASLAMALIVAPPAVAEPSSEPADVHPQVVEDVTASDDDADDPVRALAVLEASADAQHADGEPRHVARALKEVADESQADVLGELRTAGTSDIRVLNHFWILNAMLVEFPADEAALTQLASLNGIDRIVPNYEIHTLEPESGAAPHTIEDRTYGIDTIGAHDVWDELGLTGDGIRVATLDSGVDISHPDLAGKMATDDEGDPHFPGGWMQFDQTGHLLASEPHDSAEHGTHVAGTIHGGDASDYAIGVAPGADMMHGLVLSEGLGAIPQVLAGMQWAMDPTDANGNPAGAPADVVNMSLGLPTYIPELIEPTQHIRAAGIFPAFAVGNLELFGDCGRSGNLGSSSPANIYEAVAVGATDINDDVASFSCGEPIDTAEAWGDDADPDWPDEYVKPDLTAPGDAVLSAVPGEDWEVWDGTSMATPHVAGTVALMLSGAHGTPVDTLFDTLADTAFWDDQYADAPPDERYGYGRIDAYAAVDAVALDAGVTGVVTSGGEPVAGATVSLGDHSVRSNNYGAYTIHTEPGTYQVDVAAFAYEPTTASVTVPTDDFVGLDFDLDPSPAGEITGEVRSAATGEPVDDAVVRVHDIAPFARSDSDGTYTINDIPEGEYTVSVTATGYVDSEPRDVTVAADEALVANFALDVLPEPIGLWGDHHSGEPLETALADRGYESEAFMWGDDPADYPVIVLNSDNDDLADGEFQAFLDQAEDAGTGLVFLDTWADSEVLASRLNSIELLVEELGNPASRGTGSGEEINTTAYVVTEEHPIVEGYEPGDEVVFDTTSQWKDHAWFDDYVGDGVTLVADVAVDGDVLGHGIGTQESDGNRNALLSMHGASTFLYPDEWEEEAHKLLHNAVDWVWDHPESDIAIEPDTIELSVEAGATAEEQLTVLSTGQTAVEWEINIAETAASCEPTDLPWLSADPMWGVTPPEDADTVNVVVDAQGLDTGEYQAALCVDTSAGEVDVVSVPILVEVTDEGDEPVPPGDPVDLVVTPDESTIGVDGVVQLEATAIYEDDETADVTGEADWVSEDTDTATVDDAGSVTGVAEGDTDVTATFEGESDFAAVTVTDDEVPPPEDPVDLVVSPGESTIGVDGVVQLEATAVYDDDTEAPVTEEADWVSADPEVASVDDQGLVVGVAEGATEVTATFEDVSDSATVTVDAEVEPGPEGLERISAEPGRVEVAIAASQHRFGDGETNAMVLARADEYPDALAGTPLAAEHDAPLLLTSSDQLLDNVADEIARVLGEDGAVYLAGGTAALDETVENAVDDLGYNTLRLGGQTRFETAGLIADELGERSQVLVTTGLDFPDALTAGAAAAAHDGVVLLSADEEPHEVVDDYLDGFDGEVTAVGGPATRAYPDAEAVMGQTRDETAVAVAEAFFDEPSAFGVARRDDYPDALAGGAHIAAYEGPLLLSYTEDVPEETAEWLQATEATGGFVYGGTAAIDEETFDELEDLTFGDDNDDDDNDDE